MDLLKEMNDVVNYIEENLTESIQVDMLSRMACCSVCEFSRIFSFMAGMSVSEYIRRRRLSQAVFDIQNGNEKLIDIASKYGYESQAAFSRAFKELHNQTPLSARKSGVFLKTYPKLTFKLIIKGVVEMDFRIENRQSFKIIGLKCAGAYDDSGWFRFQNQYDSRLRNGNGAKSYYKAPFWMIGAYKCSEPDGEYVFDASNEDACMIGAELCDEPILEGMDIETVPAATWAVFSCQWDPQNDATGKTYARIISEWMPLSGYKRDHNAPYIETFSLPGEADPQACKCEVWVPVLKK